MHVRYSYLSEQFKNCDDLFEKIKKFVPTGDFTLGKELEKFDKPFPKEFPIRREAFVAPTREEAIKLAAPFLAKKYQSYHGTGQSDQLPEGESLDGDFYELVGDRFLIGSPEEVSNQILTIKRKLGVNHFIFSMEWAGMEASVATDCMHLMAEEVFPNVKSTS